MLSGDPNPWRTVGSYTWHDPYAELENTQSKAFHTAVQHETQIWNHAIRTSEVSSWEKDFQAFHTLALPKSPRYAHESTVWNNVEVRIQYGYSHRIHAWIGTHVHTDRVGVEMDPESNLYLTLHDIGQGAEVLQLSVYAYPSKEPIWTKSPVGPNAYFSGTHIVYQTVSNALWYPGVVQVTKASGLHPHTVWMEEDTRVQIELSRSEDTLFLKRQNALTQQLGYIQGNKVHWIPHTPKGTLVPIAREIYGTNSHLVVHQTQIRLPNKEYLVDAMPYDDQSILLTTTKQAVTSLSMFHIPSRTFRTLVHPDAPNQILLPRYSKQTVIVHVPNKSSFLQDISTGNTVFRFPEPLRLPVFHHGRSVSKDGTHVPYTIVSHVTHPKTLIVSAYGAYGISSARSYPIRWLPFLQRGYAFAVVSPRGGREDGDAWYDGGRTATRKQNTFDDTASAIHTIQTFLSIPAKRTIFYGRSAGGLLAAAIAQQYPSRVGSVYAEVPYVDVLRTTSNPDLPLTKMEYDEFGDPRRPADLHAIQTYSPVDTVYERPKQAPVIVVKTALHDVQVLPYEALKWAKTLRRHHWEVYVGIDSEGGHFSEEKTIYRAYAEDAVLLHRRLSKSKTRRRKSSRKHFTTHSTSPPAV